MAQKIKRFSIHFARATYKLAPAATVRGSGRIWMLRPPQRLAGQLGKLFASIRRPERRADRKWAARL